MFPGLVDLPEAHRGRRGPGRADDADASAVRRYDPERKMLPLSEVLRRGSRNFQLAYQVGLLTQGAIIDRIAAGSAADDRRSRAPRAGSRWPTISPAPC